MASLRFPQLWDGCIYAICPSRDRSRSNIVTDFSGGNAVSSLVNMDPATDWVARAGGVALDLDVTNDYIQLPTAKYLMVTGRPFAVTWWERLASSVSFMARFQLPTEGQSSGWIAFMSSSGSYTPISWSFTNGASGTGIRPSAGPTVASAVGVWRHWCITGSNATSAATADHSIYIDGVDYALTTGSSVNDRVTARIGWDGSISGTNALIDDVRIYSRRLMPSEAQLLSRRRGVAYEVKRSRIRQTVVTGGAGLEARIIHHAMGGSSAAQTGSWLKTSTGRAATY